MQGIAWQNDQSKPPTSTNIMKCNFPPYQHHQAKGIAMSTENLNIVFK
jgi:hypothetical protein